MDSMKILILEDDIKECDIYRKIIANRKDIEIVKMADSVSDALKYVKKYMPDGIILDLELNKGNGSGTGFDFLEALKKIKLVNVPKIIVTTNICSDSVYDFLHGNGVDFIFYKKQNNFSQENVINTLLLINGYGNSSIVELVDRFDENNDKIYDLINSELDLIGVSSHLKGRKYLYDAILYIIENWEANDKITVIQFLVNKYKKSNSTISRAMQNAILHAWRISPLEDLNNYYTARINYETGVPTPTEFIYFYADKVRKQI